MTAPVVLLPYQQTWIADESPVKAIEKSRRIGISWAEASDAALTAAAAAGMDTWYMGYNHDMAREFIGDVGFWARHYQLAANEVEEEVIDDEGKDILTYRIRFASGFRVTALSSRPTNLRGKKGRIVIDEAAFHDDLPGLLKAALAVLIWGGRVIVISTHDGLENPFNTLIQDVRAGKRKYGIHRVTFREAIKQGLYRRICLATGRVWSEESETAWVAEVYHQYGDDADEELDVVPAKSGIVYLSRAVIENCMETLPIARWAAPWQHNTDQNLATAETEAWCEAELGPILDALNPNQLHAVGEDFGRVRDLTVIAVLALESGQVRRCVLLVELATTPFHQQKQVLFFILERLSRLVGVFMDARGNGMYLAEVARQRFGSVVTEVQTTNAWYGEHMPRMKGAFDDRTLVVPEDEAVLDDLRLIRLIDGVPKIPSTRNTHAGQSRHGDAAIAFCMAYAASRSNYEAFDYEAVSRRNRDGDPWARPVRATAGFGNLRGCH